MRKLLRFLSFACLGVLVIVLVLATLFEKFYGHSFVLDNVYHSLWFVVLWGLLAVSAMIYLLCVSRRKSLLLLHAALVVVLLGACISFLTSEYGEIMLTSDRVQASVYTTAKGELGKLPFRLQLDRVETLYSPGGELLRDYKVLLVADDGYAVDGYVAALNSPARIKGYTFCIKEVSDGNVLLMVAHDSLGRAVSYMGYMMVCMSFLLLFFDRRSCFCGMFREWRGKRGATRRERSLLLTIILGRMGRVLAVPLIIISLLWYRRGVFPAANVTETLVLLASVMALMALFLNLKKGTIFLRRALLVTACAAVVVAVCCFDWDNNVQPILSTPLLAIHVTTIIVAYALLCCAAINAVIALCSGSGERIASLAVLGRLLLYPATMLLSAGIFIGAVWGSLSWGRYWGWDPKEVWALVTLLVCALPFHSRSLPFLARPVVFHVFCLVAFAAVLFTWFGVNYLLGGLHSYN